jgi:hypothetical protein
VIPAEGIHAEYPKNLTAAMLEEQARVLAQQRSSKYKSQSGAREIPSLSDHKGDVGLYLA